MLFREMMIEPVATDKVRVHSDLERVWVGVRGPGAGVAHCQMPSSPDILVDHIDAV